MKENHIYIQVEYYQFGYNSLADLSAGVAANNPRTIAGVKGKQLYKIGTCRTWGHGSFIASIGDIRGENTSILSISYRFMGEIANVSYSKTESPSLGVSIYKKVENDVLNVYLYSSISNDSYNPTIGVSSSNIQMLGEVTDLSSYELVASF